ncbi:hypothetical protein BZZ01_03560 [Nostocales cyanobacterium HT-58-2]|nr:hypothetical protein BZZ01_03560 [Nostocales cyanobacterium HT-58-2]
MISFHISKIKPKLIKTAAADRDSTAALAVELGKEKGYSFTLEEAQAYIDEINANNVPQGELSDELLESVAGGMKTYLDNGCQITNSSC